MVVRAWKAERFIRHLTKPMHRSRQDERFERRMQIAELDDIAHATAAQTGTAENYVGLPL